MKRFAAIVAVLAFWSQVAAGAPHKAAPPLPALDKAAAPDEAAAPKTGSLYNKPVYNAATGSYFELFFPDKAVAKSMDTARSFTWTEATEIARGQFYKGTRGRLALVENRQTNDFLIETFRPSHPAWIGLRFRCDVRALQWVTGKIWPLTSYANWGPVWNVAGSKPYDPGRINCGRGGGALPVHYWGRAGSYKWNANGDRQRFSLMFVEFPTGRK